MFAHALRRLGAASRCSLAIAVVALVVASCGDVDLDPRDTVRGSGDLETTTREVSGFSEILVENQGDAQVVIGDTESLRVTADDNVMEHLEIGVVGSRLELGVANDIELSSATIRYEIEMTSLIAVEIRGSGDVEAAGVESDSFEITISGSGRVEPEGTSDSLEVRIDGSGDVEAGALMVDVAEVRIDGSGNAEVNATDELDVVINGSGNVRYLGDPSLDQTIGGSGDVSPA